MRGLHYYGASAMVLMVGLHMVQDFLTALYKFPREMNWATGVRCCSIRARHGFHRTAVALGPKRGRSVVVAAEQAGRSPLISSFLAAFIYTAARPLTTTFNRFFVLHVFILPSMIFAFVGLHLWLVMRHGISEPPKSGEPVDPRRPIARNTTRC